jgi:hypothetical protein
MTATELPLLPPPPELLTPAELLQRLADARAAVRVYSDLLKIAVRASRRRARQVAVPVRSKAGKGGYRE